MSAVEQVESLIPLALATGIAVHVLRDMSPAERRRLKQKHHKEYEYHRKRMSRKKMRLMS